MFARLLLFLLPLLLLLLLLLLPRVASIRCEGAVFVIVFVLFFLFNFILI